jgi:LCP family protein required for cell wall assembly
MRRGIARHGRLKRHPLATAGKIVLSVACVMVLSAVGVVGVAAVNLRSDAPPPVHLVHLAGQKTQEIPDIGALQGGINILIAASDTRTGQGDAYGTTDDSSGVGLNDVTMLLHLSKDHTHAEVVSFPRDLMIPFPKCPDGNGGWNSAMSKVQLNTSLVDGGLPCTVLVIENLTGVSIQAAGLITFDGVVAMSNAVGGVTVCIGGDGIDDPDTELNLPPGQATLQGVQAAQFLRTRHGVNGGSDLARISNQQVFLSSLVRTILSSGTLTNPLRVWAIAKAATQNITFSDNLANPTTLYQLAMAVKDLNFGQITFVQYPVFADPDDSNRVVPDDDSAQTLMDAIKNDQPLAVTAGTGQGSVVSTSQPSAPPAPAPTPTTAGEGGTATSTPTSTAAPVQLSDNVYGQSASTQTCSNGSG